MTQANAYAYEHVPPPETIDQVVISKAELSIAVMLFMILKIDVLTVLTTLEHFDIPRIICAIIGFVWITLQFFVPMAWLFYHLFRSQPVPESQT